MPWSRVYFDQSKRHSNQPLRMKNITVQLSGISSEYIDEDLVIITGGMKYKHSEITKSHWEVGRIGNFVFHWKSIDSCNLGASPPSWSTTYVGKLVESFTDRGIDFDPKWTIIPRRCLTQIERIKEEYPRKLAMFLIQNEYQFFADLWFPPEVIPSILRLEGTEQLKEDWYMDPDTCITVPYGETNLIHEML